jgi:hypothetical protein
MRWDRRELNLKTARALLLAALAAVMLAAAWLPVASAPQQAVPAGAVSDSCIACHAGNEPMHSFDYVPAKVPATDFARRGADREGLTCVDCHGGNGALAPGAQPDINAAHVRPRNPRNFPTSANPVDLYAAINDESPEFIRFMNPSDLRIADQTCGRCHGDILVSVRRSVMSHNAMAHGAVFYNNGAFERKVALYGEAYDREGRPAELVADEISAGARAHGAIDGLVPHPAFPITRIKDPLRVAEVDNPALGLRGPGTDGRISAAFLNVLKTRLNDPTLWMLGPNRISGDYRAAGCASCHVIYANDSDPWSSAQFAKYGNRGNTFTNDRALAEARRSERPGHPIRHRFETSIPASQCLTCHYHQGDGALGTFLGRIWWDRETEAAIIKQLGAEPEYGRRDPETGRYRMESLSEHNPEFDQAQFASFNAHGWNFVNVYKRDRRGRLLDAHNQVIAEDDPAKWQRAVHLRDIHLEKGMQCIDCHTQQDTHGDGNIYPQMTDYIEIRCIDCHGTVSARASLTTSGMPWQPNDLRRARTPFADPERPGERLPQFFERGGRIYQRSKMTPGLEWEVTQVADVVNPARPEYSPKAAYAKLVRRDGSVHFSDPDQQIAHSYDQMECTTCHSSWQTTCSGCHLPLDLNVVSKDKHYEDRLSRGYAPYYRQVVRTDLYFFGIGTTNHGNKLTPFRPASAVIVSAWDRNRNNIVHQQPLVSSPGFANEAMTPHPPHTVRKLETRTCTDCHMAPDASNNAMLATAFGFGSNSLTFMGTYVYIAENGRGVTAIEVTEGREPQPVIGSNFHRILRPESYDRFVAGGRRLPNAYARRAPRVLSVATRGEYLLAAEGPDGVRLYDVADINNKSAAQRIRQARSSPMGETTRVRSRNATFVHLPVSLPVLVGTEDRRALNRQLSAPEIRRRNNEEPLAELYRYALVTDAEEGLILIDIDTLADGDPENNHLHRAVTFNPDGALTGARMVRNLGNYAYVVSEQTGLAVVDLRIPTSPRLVWRSPAGQLNGARAIELQLHYAFVLDRDGLKVFETSSMAEPRLVPGATLPIADARNLAQAKTYLYIAAGREGLVIVDIERPEQPRRFEYDRALVPMEDATDVAVATTNVSYFAYVADGRAGLKVVGLIQPPETPGHLGFATAPTPRLVAHYPTRGAAVAVSRGQIRDRFVDESGNQIAVTNRLGSRPLNRDELRRFLFRTDGQPLRVTDELPHELEHGRVNQRTRVSIFRRADRAEPAGGQE